MPDGSAFELFLLSVRDERALRHSGTHVGRSGFFLLFKMAWLVTAISGVKLFNLFCAALRPRPAL
jgi:hypothetical protein